MKSENEREFQHDGDALSWHLFVTYPDTPVRPVDGPVAGVDEDCVCCGRPAVFRSGLCSPCEEGAWL